MCVWFGGSQEGKADISIWGSRLAPGSDRWSEAVKLSDDPDRSEQNPVLFQAPDNVLWLLWTAQFAGNQDTAIVRYRLSHDGGRSWGAIDTLLDQPGTFIRQPISVMSDGNWLLPVFYCRTEPGEKWVGNNDVSAVKISSDCGKSWRDVAVPESLGCVHMSITPLRTQTGSLLPQPLGGSYLVQPVQRPGRELVCAVPTTLPNTTRPFRRPPWTMVNWRWCSII